MVNYSNGKIYKIEPICDFDEGDIYIGSTTKAYLCQRLDEHRSKYKNNNFQCRSSNLFLKYGLSNCKIILLELVNANSKDELHVREAFYISNNKCINKVIPGRTPEQYRIDNKESKKLKSQEYYNKNKEVKRANRNAYYELNKVQINEKLKAKNEKRKELKNIKL